MTALTSINNKIQIEETSYNNPVSENVMQRVGGSINFLIDQNNLRDSEITALENADTSLDTRLDALEGNNWITPTKHAVPSQINGNANASLNQYCRVSLSGTISSTVLTLSNINSGIAIVSINISISGVGNFNLSSSGGNIFVDQGETRVASWLLIGSSASVTYSGSSLGASTITIKEIF